MAPASGLWAYGRRDDLLGPEPALVADFISDALTDIRRFRILTIADDFTRECLCLVADTSLTGASRTNSLCLWPDGDER